MSAVTVSGQFQEDYPESYRLASKVTLAGDADAARARAATKGLLAASSQLCLHARRAKPAEELAALTTEEVDRELRYVRARLFGPQVGLELYDEASPDFDQVFRDSVDEVDALWLDKYKAKFDREPPCSLVESAFPQRGLKPDRRGRVEEVLDREYARLRAAALSAEAPFLAIPKGLRRRQGDNAIEPPPPPPKG